MKNIVANNIQICYNIESLIKPGEAIGTYEPKAEGTLENLIRLSAEGARLINRISQAKG